jgi:PAS domain S-box-containing protein
LIGIFFGFLFPISATFLDIQVHHLDLSWESILFIQKEQPLHWMIDTAPIFLGLFALVGGLKQAQIIEFREAETSQAKKVSSKFDRIFQDAKFGILIFDWSTKKFENINPAFLEMLGYSQEELEHEGIISITHPDDLKEERKIFKQLLKHQRNDLQLIKRYIHKDKSIKWCKLSYSTIRNSENELSFIITLIDDITEERNMQELMRGAKDAAENANKAKSLFLANMSHEIRTPMNGILGMISLLADSNLSSEQKDLVETIQTSGNSLLTIVNDILDYSKIESGKMELENNNFNFKSTIKDSVDLLKNLAISKNLDLKYTIDELIPDFLKGDSVRLRQILINLIGNAIKFTEQGFVTLNIKTIEIKDSEVFLEFCVIDSGIGIPPEKIDLLFKSFSQIDASTARKYGGSGLGLAICSKLVEMMHGRIWIESKVNEGSKFYFTASFKIGETKQLVDGELLLTTRLPLSAKNEPNNYKILLAEDNLINQRVAALLFKKAGYDIDIANNGLEVLTRLNQNEYDFIFMDVQMPELDGVETTKQILEQKLLKYPRIIAVTANAMVGDRELYLQAGMDDYLSKPFKVEDIKAIINKWGK